MQTNFSVTEKEHFGGTRKSYLLKSEAGAIELWRFTKLGSLTQGGIEIHSRVPFAANTLSTPSQDSCSALDGAPCWHAGSTTSYTLFCEWNDFDDHQDAKRELVQWHKENFEKKASNN